MADPRCGVREWYGQGRQEVEIDAFLSFSRSPPEWPPTSRTTAGQRLSEPDVLARPCSAFISFVRNEIQGLMNKTIGMDSGQPGV
jgi:hypothetical protein